MSIQKDFKLEVVKMFKLNGAAIRSLMIERQMTLSDFAKNAGINPGTAAKVMRGDAKANARTTGRIATALGVSADEILLPKS